MRRLLLIAGFGLMLEFIFLGYLFEVWVLPFAKVVCI